MLVVHLHDSDDVYRVPVWELFPFPIPEDSGWQCFLSFARVEAHIGPLTRVALFPCTWRLLQDRPSFCWFHVLPFPSKLGRTSGGPCSCTMPLRARRFLLRGQEAGTLSSSRSDGHEFVHVLCRSCSFPTLLRHRHWCDVHLTQVCVAWTRT